MCFVCEWLCGCVWFVFIALCVFVCVRVSMLVKSVACFVLALSCDAVWFGFVVLFVCFCVVV